MEKIKVTLHFEDPTGRVATRPFEIPLGLSLTKLDIQKTNGETVRLGADIVVDLEGNVTLKLDDTLSDNEITLDDLLACGFVEQKPDKQKILTMNSIQVGPIAEA